VWLFFRPHEYLLGGADAGVYVNLGANIAKTGGIVIKDGALASLDPELYPALLRSIPPREGAPYYLLPGFYVPGAPGGLVVPQFYPLHPVWLAIAYALGGLRAEFWMTPFWALLGSLAVYFTVRRLWGWRAGFLALVGLSVMALQVWFARYPTAEMLTQYLFWTGAWALLAWLDRDEPRGLWAALAGVALGSLFLARIDMYVLLALPVAIGVYIFAAGRGVPRPWREWRRRYLWLFIPLALLAVHSLLHGALLSAPYFSSQIRYNQTLVVLLFALALVLVSVSVAASILARTGARRHGAGFPGRLRALRLAAADFGRRYWRLGGAILILALAAYGYLLRPRLGEAVSHAYWYGGGTIPTLDHENLLRLGWYLGPAGVLFAAAGMAWMLVKDANRRSGFVLAAGLCFSLFYLWRIQANPHQIYAMRRYVPVVAPFFVVSAVFLFKWLYENLRGKARWVAVGLTLIWFFSIVGSARGFVSQVDFRGVTGELDRLNAALLPHSVLIFNDPAPVGVGDVLGTPLRFLYGHDVFTLRNPGALDAKRFDEAVRSWRTSGHAVYWVSVPGGYPYPGSETQPNGSIGFDLTTRALENTYDHKPSALVDVGWHISLAQVEDHRTGE
jgi:4-amino-4-deoxy-L-arabinose transferase-like glycosyltransferase